MKWIAAILANLCVYSVATAAEPISFKGKTVTMIIGYPAGGGTDLSGRLFAKYLGRYLPGNPAVIVENVPGADGLSAMNYFVQQVKPDGQTITMGSESASDPMHYRVPASHFDPKTFRFIGGVARGGSILVIRKEAEHRLNDKSATPVIIGATSLPRGPTLAAAWGIQFLGWNAKWVVLYPGTSELMLALDRGEIEMTSTSGVVTVQDLLDKGTVKILTQMGTVQRNLIGQADSNSAPLFTGFMDHRIKDPVQAKSFDYWRSLNAMDKWLALPPGAPDEMVELYRAAYQKLIGDPDFVERSKVVSEDFTPLSYKDVEQLVSTLGNTPQESIEFITSMLHAQGL